MSAVVKGSVGLAVAVAVVSVLMVVTGLHTNMIAGFLSIPVLIALGHVGIGRTDVAQVADLVRIPIFLSAVGKQRTVVVIPTYSVPVDIVVGIIRTGVANIAQVVTVPVQLIGVR